MADQRSYRLTVSVFFQFCALEVDDIVATPGVTGYNLSASSANKITASTQYAQTGSSSSVRLTSLRNLLLLRRVAGSGIASPCVTPIAQHFSAGVATLCRMT